ncbi:hypothetical protein [Pseudomonas sp. CGJS7]|uniref:hypothetical protein n=1 Tax=Pseudomonas sp. CGJS7 TaxID=3109348 RepID=UPI00300BDA1D
MTESDKIRSAAGGDIRLWIDDGQSIHMKLCNPYDDPVELTEHQALALAETLRMLAHRLQAS